RAIMRPLISRIAIIPIRASRQQQPTRSQHQPARNRHEFQHKAPGKKKSKPKNWTVLATCGLPKISHKSPEKAANQTALCRSIAGALTDYLTLDQIKINTSILDQPANLKYFDGRNTLERKRFVR